MKLQEIEPKEDLDATMKFIDAHRNWNVETQSYRDPEAENCKAPLTECELYKRGKYIILEHKGIVHYWELAETNYPYFQMAIDLMELEKPQKWKTLDKLISFRHAIRQTEVNLCGIVDAVFEDFPMTLERYNHFMKVARSQDYQHHGSHTF